MVPLNSRDNMAVNVAYLQESSQSPLTSPVVDLPRASQPGQQPPVSIVWVYI